MESVALDDMCYACEMVYWDALEMLDALEQLEEEYPTGARQE